MGGKGKRSRRLTLLCGLPEDVVAGSARATLFGRGCAMVEGQRGVVELDTSCIRLHTKDGVLTVKGEGLLLRELSADAEMIIGRRIDAMTYARAEEA